MWARGNTVRLTGKRMTMSVKAGLHILVSDATVRPQVQVMYRRLKFARRRDVDNMAVGREHQTNGH